MLATFGLSDFHPSSQISEDSQSSAPIGLSPQRTISDWVDDLTGGGVVDQINDQLMKWATAFIDEG